MKIKKSQLKELIRQSIIETIREQEQEPEKTNPDSSGNGEGETSAPIKTDIQNNPFDKEEKNIIDYDEYDVGSWLEDFDGDKLKEVIQTMMQSKVLGNELNMGIERTQTASKKK